MKTELIIDGNTVYEIDLECRKRKLERGDMGKGREADALELMGGQTPCRCKRIFQGAMLLGILCALRNR